MSNYTVISDAERRVPTTAHRRTDLGVTLVCDRARIHLNRDEWERLVMFFHAGGKPTATTPAKARFTERAVVKEGYAK
ncbi:hypothetical protein GO011_06995 [Mycobacterium sp. 20091114027_K0903767]|nr:hypothetical protein [Mycobacterium sp. 20091114027_K0903767]